jgi:hypothetical protein
MNLRATTSMPHRLGAAESRLVGEIGLPDEQSACIAAETTSPELAFGMLEGAVA